MEKLCTILIVLLSATGALGQDSDLSWQQDVVAALSGSDEIAPGVQLQDRRSASSRTLVRGYLKDQLESLGLTALSHSYSSGENVYARIPATKAGGAQLILGAHFDSVSRSPGANDNATGVALVYGVAKFLASQECLSRDIVVVFFDEEESGLVGSRNFAAFVKKNGTPTHSVHTIDQIGWDQDGDRAIELELPTKELEQTYRDVANANGFTMPLHRTSTSSTDHSSFRRQGYAAVGLTEEYINGDTTPHYHRSSDTFETVDFGYLEDTTKFLSMVLAHLASCD
jgi:hypothetical protein